MVRDRLSANVINVGVRMKSVLKQEAGHTYYTASTKEVDSIYNLHRDQPATKHDTKTLIIDARNKEYLQLGALTEVAGEDVLRKRCSVASAYVYTYIFQW